jgi:eukaryotic-like serine/threonine-protein kinase
VSPPTPTRFGRYVVDQEIGRGMMGVVYRAHDPDLGRIVALKTISIAGAVSDDNREAFEQRFLAEARAAAALSHPAIVVVHDVGRDPETRTPFIALEYLEGQTLAARLEKGPLPASEAVRVASRLAEALQQAHSRGIVHRDIKPANIMLLPSGDPKIMDFGIAKLETSQLTTEGEVFGTPAYMSPEQALNQKVDGRSDLFSLGSVLYAMLTGERAFDGPSVPNILAMIAYKDPAPAGSRVAGVPPALDLVLRRLLAKDPAERHPDGRTLAEDLDDVAHGRSPRHTAADVANLAEGTARPGSRPAVPSPPPLDFKAAPPARRTHPAWIALILAGGLALLTLSTGAVYLLRMMKAHGVPLPIPAPAAQLELTLTHSLKSGTARIFVDEDLALEEALQSRVTQKILSVEMRRGTLKETIRVPAGERTIRVQVEGETFTASRKITGTFASGVTRRLRAELGGIIKRDLDLVWTD